MTGRAIAKRSVDVALASVLLLITLPMIVIMAIGTTVSLRAWPFFTQTRIGRDGREFRFLKIRTLPAFAPRYASKYDLDGLRIPRFSLALRRLHLDELPQLFLVLTGKMSLVGPRPEMAHFYVHFSPEFAAERTAIRPGCTGLWQISTHASEMIYEHPEFDAHYLRNRTARLDLWIVLHTVRTFLPGGSRRVVALADLPSWARRTDIPDVDLRSVPSPISTHEMAFEPALQAVDA